MLGSAHPRYAEVPMKKARLHLRLHAQAVLATQGCDPVAGFPFGSVAPFCLDRAGRPLLLISRLAQHTRHVGADPRVSLFIQASTDDPQAAPRLTLAGRMERVPDDEVDAAAERYYRYFPESNDFHRQLDFTFWRLEPVKASFIAGFARVHWLEGGELLESSPFDADTERDILAHMNADHAETLPEYLALIGELPAGAATMVGLDSLGFHIRHGKRITCVPFPEPVTSPGQVRQSLIAMLQAARAAGESV